MEHVNDDSKRHTIQVERIASGGFGVVYSYTYHAANQMAAKEVVIQSQNGKTSFAKKSLGLVKCAPIQQSYAI